MFDNKSSSEINLSDSNESGAPFLVRILKYLETPQYLRKTLFPKHNDLRFVVCVVVVLTLLVYLFVFFFYVLVSLVTRLV